MTLHITPLWVSHVTIQGASEKPVKAELQPPGLNATNFHYQVRHNNVFKAPMPVGSSPNATHQLPTVVISPAYEPACGIQLEAGRDYLLAGQLSGDKGGPLMTFLCGQVLLESKEESQKHDVLEWKEVPVEMQQKLKAHAFDPLCQKLKAETAKGL
jgi:hypothetical protein